MEEDNGTCTYGSVCNGVYRSFGVYGVMRHGSIRFWHTDCHSERLLQ